MSPRICARSYGQSFRSLFEQLPTGPAALFHVRISPGAIIGIVSYVIAIGRIATRIAHAFLPPHAACRLIDGSLQSLRGATRQSKSNQHGSNNSNLGRHGDSFLNFSGQGPSREETLPQLTPPAEMNIRSCLRRRRSEPVSHRPTPHGQKVRHHKMQKKLLGSHFTGATIAQPNRKHF